LDNPIIKIIEENSSESSDKIDNEENTDPISVISLVSGKLWCAIRDRIFVVCPNSLNIQVKRLLNKNENQILLGFICC
jgi:hypothetical protein